MALEKKVSDFMQVCAGMVGRFEEDNFSQEIFGCLYRGSGQGMRSPIEQYLYTSLITVARLNSLSGLVIESQHPLGKYRADFYLSVTRPDTSAHQLIVECDSQAFHDRTEQERRYEKARERFFVMQGYKVFHYTGTEILSRPLATAAEILGFLSGQPSQDLASWVAEFTDMSQQG